MIYETLLLVGGVGLTAQALLGFAHFGGAHSSHHASGGDVHGHAHVHLHFGNANGGTVSHTHTHTVSGSNGKSGASETTNTALQALWNLFSPLALFSICLGTGVSGLAATQAIRSGPLIALLAILGGIVFYAALVRPLWRLIFQFASKPAETLSGVVAREAEAMSRFDGAGRGIVRVNVDGQVVRLLAHLDDMDRSESQKVVPGDRLLVTEIDGAKNACRVTRL